MKEFALFIFLLIFDFVIWVVLLNAPNHGDLTATFLPLIFLEIALFGCIILYKLNHPNNDDDE